MQIKNKILIGPYDIAGYYSNLAKGLKQIGVNCDFITYVNHPFNYGGETKEPFLLKLTKYANSYVNISKYPYIITITAKIFAIVFSTLWAINAIIKYDVFIFGFGKSLMIYNIDLVLLKYLNKKVISNMAHGSEARPIYIDGSFQSYDGSYNPSINKIISGAINSKKLVEKHQRLSTYLIGAPYSTSYFAEKKFINSFALGIPYENTINNFITNKSKNDSICRILHSPSHPAAKGSPKIIEAINNLKKRGYEIELTIIQGKSNSEVIYEIERCDFIVDQLYSDTPLAGFATEAAWFGKPAIVGGYGINSLKKYVPSGMWPPSKTCQPDDIELAIESLIINQDERSLLGKSASDFVRNNWNSINVAFRYKKIIDGNIPEDWWLNPYDVIYLEGAGQTREITKKNINNIVAKKGKNALQLSHRPDLEVAFLEFAGIKIDVNA
jgi:glycosyltransferase involved in cell wall biosynthesis